MILNPLDEVNILPCVTSIQGKTIVWTRLNIASFYKLVKEGHWGICDVLVLMTMVKMRFWYPLPLKQKCRHFDEILITGCTESCHFDNFQCSQWLKFRQNDDIFVSVTAKYDIHPSIIAIKQVDINQIYQILVNMNEKKSTGYDGIPCKLLTIGAFPLAGILCQLINISISECKLPDVMKLADISALFKKSTGQLYILCLQR